MPGTSPQRESQMFRLNCKAKHIIANLQIHVVACLGLGTSIGKTFECKLCILESYCTCSMKALFLWCMYSISSQMKQQGFPVKLKKNQALK